MFLKNHGENVDVIALQECGDYDLTPEIRREKCERNPKNCVGNIPMERPSGHDNPIDIGPYMTFFNERGGLGPPPGFKDDKTAEHEFPTGTTGTPGRKFYLYRQELPNAGNVRTSLAILSSVRADEVLLIVENNVKRPVIGIRIGINFYFSIHAGAFPTNPSDKTVVIIEKFLKHRMPSNVNTTFIIMGDFNKNPVSNNPDAVDGMTIKKIAPTTPTQSGGGILDYAFIGLRGNGNLPNLSAKIQIPYMSDHYLVLIKKN